MLKCGLDGIRRKLEPPPPTEENLYNFDAVKLRKHRIPTLPGSLNEALDELERDQVVRDALGPHITERFIEAKRAEYNESRIQVSQWELDRYLDIY
jgi:glutamine synthetase